jgi:hypothetical protein
MACLEFNWFNGFSLFSLFLIFLKTIRSYYEQKGRKPLLIFLRLRIFNINAGYFS